MSEPPVANAKISEVNRMATGTWGDSSALALTFELDDGRTTQPTYVPGAWQIADLLEMLDVPSVEELTGASLRVVLLDPSERIPTLTEILASQVPEPFRRAFDDQGEP